MKFQTQIAVAKFQIVAEWTFLGTDHRQMKCIKHIITKEIPDPDHRRMKFLTQIIAE